MGITSKIAFKQYCDMHGIRYPPSEYEGFMREVEDNHMHRPGLCTVAGCADCMYKQRSEELNIEPCEIDH